MKKIIYRVLGYNAVYNPDTEEVEDQEVEVTISATYSPDALETAKRDAINGEYTIEDDGEPEPTTADDVLNALLGVN